MNITISLTPRSILAALAAAALLHWFGFFVTLVIGLYIGLGIYLGCTVFRAFTRRTYADGGHYIVSIFTGILWPVFFPLFFGLADEVRAEFNFLLSNKYYYLRSPIVLRKSVDENPNKKNSLAEANAEYRRGC